MSTYTNLIAIIVQLLFATIFIIFTTCMLWDQWNIINNDTTSNIYIT
jgi:hypothetical protein